MSIWDQDPNLGSNGFKFQCTTDNYPNDKYDIYGFTLGNSSWKLLSAWLENLLILTSEAERLSKPVNPKKNNEKLNPLVVIAKDTGGLATLLERKYSSLFIFLFSDEQRLTNGVQNTSFAFHQVKLIKKPQFLSVGFLPLLYPVRKFTFQYHSLEISGQRA